MNPHYVTVFDISGKTVDWHLPAAGLLFLVVGVVLILIGRQKKWTGIRRWNGYFFVAFAIAWMLIVSRILFWDYSGLHSAYRAGEYSIVEGQVENFRPMPYQRHQEECFSVKETTFCYSDYEPTAGFNNTASHGGPIRSGLPVRIFYTGNDILRIDVREDQIPSLAERTETQATAQAEWKEQMERDPRAEKMNLAFAVAAVFVTAWWNLSWRRFMKFWVKPPNKRATIVGFRLFFLANLIGSVWGLGSQILRHPRAAHAYLDAFELAAIWIVVMILMVLFVEWQSRWRERNNKPTPAN